MTNLCSARFVLSDAKGLGIADGSRAETAAWVARYQADWQGQTWLSYSYDKLLPPHLEGALGFGLPVIFPLLFFPWLFVLLCLQAAVFFVLSLFPLVLFQVLATWPAGGGDDRLFLLIFFFFSFELS